MLAAKKDNNRGGGGSLKGLVSKKNNSEYSRNWGLPRLDSPNIQARNIIEASTNRMAAQGMLELLEHGQANRTVSSNFVSKNKIFQEVGMFRFKSSCHMT